MSENKTPKNSDAEVDKALDAYEATEAETYSLKTSNVPVSPAPKEPKQTSAKSAGAKPAKAKIARNAVVGAGDTDPVLYSRARVPGPTESRKSLTVLHLQRRLAEEGFAEANSAPGGQYEALTTRAVQQYQESIGAEVTGVLTRDQFTDLFSDDPNVTVSVDTHYDHTV